jgi:hypothetical protein
MKNRVSTLSAMPIFCLRIRQSISVEFPNLKSSEYSGVAWKVTTT